MRAEQYRKKYRELALWFLDNQTKLDWNENHVIDLANEIDLAADSWLDTAAFEALARGGAK